MVQGNGATCVRTAENLNQRIVTTATVVSQTAKNVRHGVTSLYLPASTASLGDMITYDVIISRFPCPFLVVPTRSKLFSRS